MLVDYQFEGTAIPEHSILATGEAQKFSHDNMFDLAIRTAASGGGVLLVEDIDYTLSAYDPRYRGYNLITFAAGYIGQTLYINASKSRGDYMNSSNINAAIIEGGGGTMTANSIKGNPTGEAAVPVDISIAANKFPARASTGNLEAKTITDFGLGLVGAADAVAGRTALGAAPTASPVFTGSITTPVIKPSADSTAAIKFTKADGATSLLTIDTSNGNWGFGGSPTIKYDFYGTSSVAVPIMRILGGSGLSTESAFFGIQGRAAFGWDGSLGAGVFSDFAANKSLAFQTNSVTRIWIAAAGNIGIGKTNPSEPLDVSGNIKGSGYFEFNEMSAPAAGAADSLRAYAVDNGGLTELHVRAYGESAQKIPFCARENSYSKTQGFAMVNNGNSGTSKTIDWRAGNKQKMTLTGNCEVSFTDPSGSAPLELRLIQDTTGGRTVTWSGMTLKWEGGIAATLTAASNAIDIVEFTYDSGEDTYYGSCKNDFKASA